jgi:hypothetical protein
MRQVLENTGRASRIEEYEPDYTCQHIVAAFWELKSLLSDITEPIPPQTVSTYIADQGLLLNRQERAILYQMDSAFRGALNKQRAENDRFLAEKAKNK